MAMSFLPAPARKSWRSLVNSAPSGAACARSPHVIDNSRIEERRIRFICLLLHKFGGRQLLLYHGSTFAGLRHLLNNTEILLSRLLATTMSAFPSLLRSPRAMPYGPPPTAIVAVRVKVSLRPRRIVMSVLARSTVT